MTSFSSLFSPENQALSIYKTCEYYIIPFTQLGSNLRSIRWAFKAFCNIMFLVLYSVSHKWGISDISLFSGAFQYRAFFFIIYCAKEQMPSHNWTWRPVVTHEWWENHEVFGFSYVDTSNLNQLEIEEQSKCCNKSFSAMSY